MMQSKNLYSTPGMPDWRGDFSPDKEAATTRTQSSTLGAADAGGLPACGQTGASRHFLLRKSKKRYIWRKIGRQDGVPAG